MLTLCGISLVLISPLFCFLLLVHFADNIFYHSGLRWYEFEDIYTYTKREFNLKCPKNMSKNEIIEKCGNVNNIWNGLSTTSKVDITDWSLVFAVYYISNSKIKFDYNIKDLIELKWKYRTKYLLIRFIVR